MLLPGAAYHGPGVCDTWLFMGNPPALVRSTGEHLITQMRGVCSFQVGQAVQHPVNDQMRCTIYLVDDEPEMIKALSRLLRTEGFSVQGFTSPDAFLRAFRQDHRSCLVLDVAMPGVDGLEFQLQLKQMGIRLPIIFLTGHGDLPICVRAMKAGAVDFLTKPVNDADLLRAVRAALD